ncbi:ligand-binding protein SH3 [Archaeoglobales archaeon]|nr:MAG: ligand-binding protein SH3 [Archaeoglobales archaeon]
MPVSELRGGIPLALYLGFTPVESYMLAFFGNLLPIPLLLVFLDKFVAIACKISIVDGFYNRIVSRVERRKKIIEKYGYFGLTLFVAIPLPVTGAWTGALLAFLLRMNKVKSILFISLGVAIAGIIVILASLGVIKLYMLSF